MKYEFQEYPKYLYHPTLAPAGKVFNSADETKGLARKGWVDTPAKFPKPSRFGTAARSWWSQWEWAFKALAVLLSLVAALIVLMRVLRG
jgi:hypothetical protein